MCGNLTDEATTLLWYSTYSKPFWPLGLEQQYLNTSSTTSAAVLHHIACISLVREPGRHT